ncbi:MAG: ester cyclase [Mediterranea sp.]|nr:ester cyclase [Mediterranea sp.]
MEIIVNPADATAVRNKNTLLALYDEMINGKEPLKAVRKYLVPGYIQHNPNLPTGADGTGLSFENRLKSFPNMSVRVHQVIAVGDYVWAHVNFVNIYSNDPADRGVAGVDIFKFNPKGEITEHWDVLQAVVDPAKAANDNGMF